MEKICKLCGKTFEPKLRVRNGKKGSNVYGKYCSYACCHKAREEKKGIKKISKKDGVYETKYKKSIRALLEGIYTTTRIGSEILILTSKFFPIPSKLKEQKFIAFENHNGRYYELLKNKPNNVEIYYGDVGNVKELKLNKIQHAFLDFCGTYDTTKESISKVVEATNCETLALTFSLRGNKTSIPKIIQNTQELGYSFIEGDTYHSAGTMLFLFFKRMIKKGKNNGKKKSVCSSCGELFLRKYSKFTKFGITHCLNCWKKEENDTYLNYREARKKKYYNYKLKKPQEKSPQERAWITRKENENQL